MHGTSIATLLLMLLPTAEILVYRVAESTSEFENPATIERMENCIVKVRSLASSAPQRLAMLRHN